MCAAGGGLHDLTFDPSSWFAPSACVAMALVLGLAFIGAWTANLRAVVAKMLGE